MIKIGFIITLVIVLGFFCSIISVMLTYSNFGIAYFIIMLNIILMVVLLRYAYKYANRHTVFNLVSLFSIFFAAYNGLFPIQVSIQYICGGDINYIFPMFFTINSYLSTSLLTLISAFSFIIGSISANKIRFKPKFICNKFDYNMSFIIGTLIFLAGIMLLFLDYNRIGGYFNAIRMDRVTRMNILSEMRGNMPYNSFIIVGIAFMVYSIYNHYNFIKLTFTYICIMTMIVLLILCGDRRFCLYIILVTLSLYSFIKKPIMFNKQIIIFGIGVYVLFAIFQNIRWILPLILRGDVTYVNAYHFIVTHFSLAMLLPGSTEFLGPYFSLLYFTTSSITPFGGSSYLYSLPYLLPRSLYPTIKVPTISQNFAIQIHHAFYADQGGIVGWGFNPVAESIANFGYIGPLIVFILFGFIFSLLCKIQNKGLGAILVAIMTPAAFNLNRADFANTFQEVMYNEVLAILVAITILIVKSGLMSNSKHNNPTLRG